MIGVVDYGVGNVQAFLTLFHRLGIPACRVKDTSDLNDLSRVVLPGVGHFDRAMSKLNDSGLRERLTERVLGDGLPLLGVCVGMQMLASASEEGTVSGLGWVPGKVRRLKASIAEKALPLPHMGWNDVVFSPIGNQLWPQCEGEVPRFYFLHSFYFEAANMSTVAARVNYGGLFPAAVSFRNVYGVQFHPEKSHRWGERLLGRFAGVDIDA